jgi:hypothetical protein
LKDDTCNVVLSVLRKSAYGFKSLVQELCHAANAKPPGVRKEVDFEQDASHSS